MESNEFKKKRSLMHHIVSIWKEMYGDWWVVAVGKDDFYFNPRLSDEVEIRENLMSRTYNELDSIAMSAMLTMEMKS